MKRNSLKIIFPLVIIAFLLVWMACEDFEEETYEMEVIDETAVDILSDTTITEVPAPTVLDTSGYYVINWGGGVVDSVSSSSMLNLVDTLKAKTAFVSPGNTHYIITFNKSKDNNFVLLESNVSGKIVLFTKENVHFKLIETTGSEVNLLSDAIPLETVAGYFHDTDDDLPVTLIEMRYEYQVQNADYLLQIISTEQTSNNKLNLAIVSE